jgi:hypothetical protein
MRYLQGLVDRTYVVTMIVAAVAEANECVIVTDNEQHFSGLEVLNPLRTSSYDSDSRE